MKKYLPWIIVAALACYALSGLRPVKNTGFDWQRFGRIPVLANGRFQPLDSLARNSLLQIREKSTAISSTASSGPDKQRIIPATEWLAEVMFQPEVAETRPVFRIDNPDLKQTLGLPVDADQADEHGRQALLLQTNPAADRGAWKNRRGRRKRARTKLARPRSSRATRIHPSKKTPPRLRTTGPSFS